MSNCNLCGSSDQDEGSEHVKNVCARHPEAGTLWVTGRGDLRFGGNQQLYRVAQCGRMGNKSAREDVCLGCSGCRDEKVAAALSSYKVQVREVRDGLLALNVPGITEEVAVSLSVSVYLHLSWPLPTGAKWFHATVRFSDHAPGPRPEDGEDLFLNIWGALTPSMAIGVISRRIEEQRDAAARQAANRW